MKKTLSLLLALLMCFGLFSSTGFAAGNDGPVSEVIVGGMPDTRASNVPNEFYNLGGSNKYTAPLIDLAAERGSYTKYYFATGTGNIYLKCALERSGTTTNKDRYLIVYLYEKENAYTIGTLKDTATIHFNEAEVTERCSFGDLDSNKFYYLRFYNNSSTDPGDSLDISGTIIVDDSYVY